MCAVVREITEAGSLASLNSGGGGDAGLSGGHLVICESAEVIKLLFRFVTEGATWGVTERTWHEAGGSKGSLQPARGREHIGVARNPCKML